MDKYLEGVNLYNIGEYQRSAEVFREILSQDRNHHQAWNALGLSLIQTGDLDRAEDCFSKAILLAPNNEDYIQNLDSTRLKIAAAKLDKNTTKKRRIWIKKRTNREQVNNADVVCLFFGITLLGIYAVSYIPGMYIPSPARDLLGVAGVLFCFFYVSTNFLKFFSFNKIPFRLIIFIIMMLLLLYLFVRFLLN